VTAHPGKKAGPLLQAERFDDRRLKEAVKIQKIVGFLHSVGLAHDDELWIFRDDSGIGKQLPAVVPIDVSYY
jgi:hypothetical protein